MFKINKITYTLAAIIFAVFFIIFSSVGSGVAVASAATSANDVQFAYEQTNVLDNLDGAIIGGELFDIKDYPHNDRNKLQIITFVEFCYSYSTDKQDDYGLYVYVYNPQDLVFNTRTERNTIHLKCGNSNTESYSLQFSNYSTRAGYEGRFYKFKVKLTETERKTILKNLSAESRIYEISEITLCVNGVATAYACGQRYTYTGFVQGYGSALAENDTLSCAVDGFEKYVELDVNQTVYRPQGDYYEGKQSQLNSCYFRVPEKFFTDYGDLYKIACEWYEYITKPILVTQTDYLYQRLYNLHGGNVSNFSFDAYFLIYSYSNTDTSWFGNHSHGLGWASNFSNYKDDYYFPLAGPWGADLSRNGMASGENRFDNFAAVFYSGRDKSYQDRYVSSDELTNQLLLNSEVLGEPYLSDRYSEQLFTDYVNPDHTRGHNKREIEKDDLLDVFWNVTTKSIWQTIFGGYDVNTIYDSVKAIVTVTSDDLKGSNEEISKRLYISENDVDGLKAEFAKCKDERLVLFRYGESDYYSIPCAESYCSTNTIDADEVLVKDNLQKWAENDYTAYIAQETVYLDFDIISLWFKANDGTETEVPVVMSPQDVISGLAPPPDEDYHNKNVKDILKLVFGLILAILIVVLLYPILSPIVGALVKFLIWLITAPFKAIGKLFSKKE